MNAIQVKNLHKSYGDKAAVKGIHFSVKKNAFFALLGPNGAGKSTTIEILSTLLEKNQGDIAINGYTLGQDDAAIRQTLGVVFQYSVLDPSLTVLENLKLRAAFYHLNGEALEERLAFLDQLIHFSPFQDQRFQTLSGGQKRKADIARALLHNPEILILDEPTTGLDPKSRKEIWQLILQLKSISKMTVFLTTHYMEEVLDADHVIILHEGRIRAEDSAERLRIKYANDTLKIVPKNDLESQLKQANIPYQKHNTTLHLPIETSFQGIDLVQQFKDQIETFEIVKANMDDVFLNITGERLEAE